MVVIQIGKRKPMGTFKRRLLDLLEKKGTVIFKDIHYSSAEDRLSCGEYRLTDKDKVLIVIDSDKPAPLGHILLNKLRANLLILNEPVVSNLSKADHQYALKLMGVRTPEFTIGTVKLEIPEISVLKPSRGEKGKGVELGIAKAKYFQEWVRPPAMLGTVFDLRFYVFMGHIIGCALRIAKPDKVSKKNKSFWGISNTEGGGRIHFPLEAEKMQNTNKWSKKPYKKIWKWLNTKADMKEIMEDAIHIMRSFGLAYGAVDFVFDKKGNHYAIDINPNAAQGKKKVNLGRLRFARRILMQSGFADLPENYVFEME